MQQSAEVLASEWEELRKMIKIWVLMSPEPKA